MGLGWTELLLLFGVVLLLFGPDRLPKLARGLGESLNLFKRGLDDVSGDVEETREALEREAAGVAEPVTIGEAPEGD